MRRSRRAYLITGGLLLGVILFVMLFAEQITSVSPHYWDAKPSILLGRPPFPPSPQHPLGTDQYGRDVWSRIAYGSRWSMLFAFLIMAARLFIATPAAFLAVFGPKRAAWLVDKLYVITSAIPPLLIYILILAVPQLRVIGLWPSVVLTVSLLTFMEWPRVAVVLKGRLSSLMAEPFVEGAVAVGNNRWQLFTNHLFPHLWPVLLHLIAAEMARALVVIAQLGIFGIMVGGGVTSIVMGYLGRDVYVVTSGLPEWGTQLADGRLDLRSYPWIPLPPAAAFLIGVVAFSLLSQGLETVTLSVQEIRAATTARFSRRWRWALPVLVAAAVFLQYQGLPWGRKAEIVALADRQAAALTTDDLDAYAATLHETGSGATEDLRRWAARLAGEVTEVRIIPERERVYSQYATVALRYIVTYADGVEKEIFRETSLVRRWGRWYETGEVYRLVNGYHTDVWAVFDPVDPRSAAIPRRWNVQYLATSADHAFESVKAVFPSTPNAPRPVFRLYPTRARFLDAVGPQATPATNVWYEPGGPIRLAPEFLLGFRRWETQRSLALELMKFLTQTRLGQERVSPLTLGQWDLHREDNVDTYRIAVDDISGQPLFTLPELFAASVSEMSTRQSVYAVQAALLAEYAEARVTERPLVARDLPELAAKLGTTAEGLSGEYYKYVQERIYSESLLTVPQAIPRIPKGLPEAVASRAEAISRNDLTTLAAGVDPQALPAQQAWLEQLRREGLIGYAARFIDFRESKGSIAALVLESATFADGREVSGVVLQGYQLRDGVWTVTKVGSLLPGPADR